MDTPKKWWSVKAFDIGRELGDPDYVDYADKEIKRLTEMIMKANNYLSGGGCGAKSVQHAAELFDNMK